MKKLLALVPLLLAACGNDSTRLALSSRAGPAPGSQALTLENGIAVERVRIVVDRVRLSRVGVDASSEGAEEDHEVLRTPFLVDLASSALDGTLVPVIGVDAPAGTFEEIELRIHKINPNEVPADQAAAFADLAGTSPGNGASIRVDGTIDGAAFAYLAFFEEELEFQGPFVVEEDATSNVTLNLDPSAWFTADGARLDPRDEANRSRIEQNIKASLRAFDDDDRDGRED